MIRLLLLLVWPTSLFAQDMSTGERLQRALEMPGHRALHMMIEENAPDLKPFVTDGCSGGLSSSWRVVADIFPGFAEAHDQTPPWETCCEIHDRAYHNAGETDAPEQSFAARLSADQALKTCVVEHSGVRVEELSEQYGVSDIQVEAAYRIIGDTMFNAVRVGGGPCSGLPWRWGFGYPQCVPGL